MTNEEYLGMTEVNFILNDLISQASYQKPEEPADFAQAYFQKIQSGLHVIGADYPSYISACSYNRRSFVHCLMKAFSGFCGTTEFTAFEFFHLVELLSPSFPRSLVIDAVHAARPSIPFSEIDNVKLPFKEISFTVYVFILFGDWLMQVNKMFTDDNSLCIIEAHMLRHKLSDLSKTSKSQSVCIPPTDIVDNALNEIVAAKQQSRSSPVPKCEVSFTIFQKALLSSGEMVFEVHRLANNTFVDQDGEDGGDGDGEGNT